MSDDINPYAAPQLVEESSLAIQVAAARWRLKTPALVVCGAALGSTLFALLALFVLASLSTDGTPRGRGEDNILAALCVIDLMFLMQGVSSLVTAFPVWRQPTRAWVRLLCVIAAFPNPFWLLTAPAALIMYQALHAPELQAVLDANER